MSAFEKLAVAALTLMCHCGARFISLAAFIEHWQACRLRGER